MILKQKIGVVGNGFVGGAVKFGFHHKSVVMLRLEFTIRIQINQHTL